MRMHIFTQSIFFRSFFYAISGSVLYSNSEWIHELHLTVFTKNERLVVATMFLNNMFGGF